MKIIDEQIEEIKRVAEVLSKYPEVQKYILERYTPNTEVQKERGEAVRGFGKYLTDEGWVDGYTYGYDLYKWIETYLSQTKGGEDGSK